ncbi:MAG: type IX secretion system membrane protein PorP/SprF [Bacteroidetes bacterium]|nr:type IX secretion system membrane protein PorP/SprF [Bacteroidota bacterium]
MGLSSKHLFDRAFAETGSENSTNFSSLGYHFYTYIGGYIRFGKNVIYKSSILVKYVDKGTFSFDFNSAVMLKNLIWVGVSFKSATNSVVITTELKLNSKYRLGYSYDSYLGDVRAYNIGSHEIKISYEVDLYKRRNSFPLSF